MFNSLSIALKRANFKKDLASRIAFRRDSFQVNYGSEKSFDNETGSEDGVYAVDLQNFQEKFLYGVTHVLHDNQIIDQVEFQIEALYTDKATIPMFYLVPSARGSGIGIHDHLNQILRENGCNGARIPVSSSNDCSMAFYKKHGWRYAKPDLNSSNVDLYQLSF